MQTFRGFPRVTGPAGIRNVVLVVSGDLCCNPWSKDIASHFPGCCALLHKHGVGNYAPDRLLFRRLITGITLNPNVSGLVFVSSGNEDHSPEEMLAAAREAGKPCHVVSARSVASSGAVIARGTAYAEDLVHRASAEQRVPCDIAELRIGLNCAGTDTVSGDIVHPVLGYAVDRLVEQRGTAILTETSDLIGLDDLLFNRCVDTDDRSRLVAMYESRRKILAASGEKIDDIELVAFNREGGLTSLRHKAEVAIRKSGDAPIVEVVDYGVVPVKRGLVFMDGPAMTDFVMTGLMSAGAHMMINTCGAGEGNKMPFTVGADTPSPILPAFKMTGSPAYYAEPSNRIDFNAATGLTIEETAERLLEAIAGAASGTPVKTEAGRDCFLNIPTKFHQA